MLILSRNPQQSIIIYPDTRLDPTTPIGEVFKDNPMAVTVLGVNGNQVRLGIRAPRTMAVHRDEIYDRIQRNGSDGIIVEEIDRETFMRAQRACGAA